jgi:hypothetical protein
VKLHHLGVVISNVDETLLALNLSREDISEKVYDPIQKNNLYFIYLADNNMWLELVEPKSENSSTINFARKFSMGLHHIAIGSDDLDKVEELYEKRPASFVLGKYKINVESFGGEIKTLFIAVKGLILEFVCQDK